MFLLICCTFSTFSKTLTAIQFRFHHVLRWNRYRTCSDYVLKLNHHGLKLSIFRLTSHVNQELDLDRFWTSQSRGNWLCLKPSMFLEIHLPKWKPGLSGGRIIRIHLFWGVKEKQGGTKLWGGILSLKTANTEFKTFSLSAAQFIRFSLCTFVHDDLAELCSFST